MNKTKEKGITLVALVTTIVILLILAGVSISLVLSENGIIAKAKEAKKLSTIAHIKETISLELASIEIEYNDKGIKINDSEKIERVYNRIVSDNTINDVTRVGDLVIFDNEYVISMATAQDAAIADSSVWNYYTSINWKGYDDTDYLNFAFITGYKGTDKDITIPEYVIDNGKICVIREIRNNWDGGFSNNDNIETIRVSDNILKIEQTIFSDMKNLKKVIISDCVKDIANNVFANDYKLEEVKLSKEITEIKDATFYRCFALKSIEIPEKVETIGTNAFTLCLSIGKLEIPASVKEIKDNAFAYMGIDDSNSSTTGEGTGDTKYRELGYTKGSLKEIILNEGLQTIGNNAFTLSATVEKDLTVPSSVKTIGTNAFFNFGKIGGGILHLPNE